MVETLRMSSVAGSVACRLHATCIHHVAPPPKPTLNAVLAQRFIQAVEGRRIESKSISVHVCDVNGGSLSIR